MVTTTTVYSFQKPDVSGDEDAWGGYLNANIDKYESILTGNTTITSLVITTADINGGTLDNVVIGGSTAAAVTGTTITGTSFVSSGNMTFGDSNKAIFGAGSDLQIYHDGAHSYISDQGTGNLRILAGEFNVKSASGNTDMIYAVNGGAVTLYNNGNAKIATTSTGIDVTGTVTADSLTVDGTAVEVASINSTQNGAQIHFDSASTSSDWSLGISNSADGDFLIYQNAHAGAGDILLYTNGSERLRITSDGKIGVGTSAPIYAADIKTSGTNNGQLRVGGGSTSATGLLLEQTNSGTTTANIQNSYYATSASASLSIKSGYTTFHTGTSGSERMRIDSSGRLLLNTTVEGYTDYADDFTISNTSGRSGMTIRSGATSQGSIFFSDSNANSGAGAYAGYVTYIHSSDSLQLGSGSVERMRIDSSGNVGIGTSSPSSYNAAANNLVISDGGNAGITIVSPSTDSGSLFFADGTSGTAAYAGFVQYGHAAEKLILGTGGTTKVTIDGTGNVGINQSTPSSYQNYTYLDVFGRSTTQGGIFKSSTSDASTQAIFYTTGTEAILATTTNDPLVFTTNNSERMRIASYGSVGIGTLTPTNFSTYRYLDIVGSATTTGGVIQLKTSDGSVNLNMYSYNGGGVFGTATNHNLAFTTNNSVKMVILADGKIGVGTTTPSDEFGVNGNQQGGDVTIRINNDDTLNASSNSRLRLTTPYNEAYIAAYTGSGGAGYLVFANENAERMRIDSLGNVGIGTSSISSEVKLDVDTGANSHAARFRNDTGGYASAIFDNQASSGTRNFTSFRINNSAVGSITSTGSTTAYNTSSDHRLKENVVELTGATARLKQLEPKRFNFIADADTTVDGFLAHEVQSVVPEAICGTHNEVDADGNPVYQGIDQSKLVPLLVATIKELEARITALEGE